MTDISYNIPMAERIIRTKEDLKQAVEYYGILPFFANSLPGFSVEEMSAPEAYFDKEPGVWEWKGPVITELNCLYGKFFSKRAAFISKEYAADFCNWRRDGYDFDARFNDGLSSYDEQYLYNLLASHHSILSRQLKMEGGYVKSRNHDKDAWEPRKGFDRLITGLQMKGYITTVNFEYEMDKKGEFYGWGIARYAVVENYYGNDFTEEIYKDTPDKSYERIVQKLHRVMPEIQISEIEYFLNHK